MDAQACAWFVFGENREVLVFVGDVLCLNVSFECVWIELEFVWTSCYGPFGKS